MSMEINSESNGYMNGNRGVFYPGEIYIREGTPNGNYVSGNITPTIQYEADNRKYFSTNSSNLLLTTTLTKSNLNSVFTKLSSSDGIVIDLNTWIGSLGSNKTTLYNAISGLNWGIGSPLTHNGNNTTFGINNNVSLGSRYTIANYISSATFGSQTNLKLFYKSATEVGVFNGTLANIGVASYGTDQTKHFVNNLRQPENTTLWGSLQNGYLYYDASNGKAIYFDNGGIGYLNSNLLTKYTGRWLPYLDAGNYYGQGANKLVFGDNSWNAGQSGYEGDNLTWGGINMFVNLYDTNRVSSAFNYSPKPGHWKKSMGTQTSNSYIAGVKGFQQNGTLGGAYNGSAVYLSLSIPQAYIFFPLY